MKTSNKFTLARLLFAPIFFLFYFVPLWTGVGKEISILILIPCLIFAELTDFWDGFYARKNNEVSDFGKMFDPFADVMLHLTSFVCFLLPGINKNGGSYLPLGLFLLIFYREFTMNFLRMVAAKKGIAIAARKGGKLKTVLYVVAEFYILIIEALQRLALPVENIVPVLKNVGLGLFIFCVILAYTSFIDYLLVFGKTFFKDEK